MQRIEANLQGLSSSITPSAIDVLVKHHKPSFLSRLMTLLRAVAEIPWPSF
jgi:hypothetical protein